MRVHEDGLAVGAPGARRPVEKLHRKGTAFNNLICGFLTQHAVEGMYYQS